MTVSNNFPSAAPQNNFGLLRLILAALVVVSHSSEIIDGNRSREILTCIFGTISLGEAAVDGFFIISGYLIIKSFRNSLSILDYLTKRILRIYPGFIVAFLISTIIVGPLAGADLTQIPILSDLVRLGMLGSPFTPGAFNGLPYPSVNGSLWSIPYEFVCYLLVIFVGFFASRGRRSGYFALLIFLFILYLLRHYLSDIHYVALLIPFGKLEIMIRLAFVFFIGGAFYVWRDLIVFTHYRAMLAAFTLVALLFVPQLAEPAIAVLGGYIIFWYAFACPLNRLSRKADNNDPSYGLYLYAWPIQNLLVFKVSGITPWTVTAIALPTAFTAGLLSWYLIEKPALRYRPLLSRLRQGPASGSSIEDSLSRKL